VAYFTVMSQHLHVVTEVNHKRPQSGQPAEAGVGFTLSD